MEIYCLRAGYPGDGAGPCPASPGADYADARLTVRCQSGGHNLITLLDCLNKQGLSFGRVYSEPPTLNDVFLEITGKELRD